MCIFFYEKHFIKQGLSKIKHVTHPDNPIQVHKIHNPFRIKSPRTEPPLDINRLHTNPFQTKPTNFSFYVQTKPKYPSGQNIAFGINVQQNTQQNTVIYACCDNPHTNKLSSILSREPRFTLCLVFHIYLGSKFNKD